MKDGFVIVKNDCWALIFEEAFTPELNDTFKLEKRKAWMYAISNLSLEDIQSLKDLLDKMEKVLVLL